MKNSTIKTYGDIVKRIAEIIKISEEKKKELDETELKENFNDHFTYILYYDIDVSLASEFKELVDAERTFNLIKQDSLFTYLDKTRNLLFMCKESANLEKDNYVYYEEIAQIISESYGKSSLDLTEYKGYYILREKFNKWLWLMRKLELFPNETKMSEKEKKDKVNRYLFQNHEQYDRLQTVFVQLKDKEKIIDLNQIHTFKPNLNNKHSDIIYLGLNGDLKLDYIRELKFIYSDSEYQDLLDELSEWQIFSEKEINFLRNTEVKSTVILEGKDSFDTLIKFFCNNNTKITDANALRYLKPVIGEENLKTLVDTLHMLGTIPGNVYEEYLKLETETPTRN